MTRKVYRGLLLLILAFIWGHSLQSGTASKGESDYVLNVTLSALNWFPDLGWLDFYTIRKLAHLTEFTALGFVLSGLLHPVKPYWVRWSTAYGALVGVIDEFLQLFSPGRSSQISDIILDTVGILVGSLLFGIIKFIEVRYAKSELHVKG